MIHQVPRGSNALRQRLELTVILEWVAGRHQPPDRIQTKSLQRLTRDEPMSLMRGIQSCRQTAQCACRGVEMGRLKSAWLFCIIIVTDAYVPCHARGN